MMKFCSACHKPVDTVVECLLYGSVYIEVINGYEHALHNQCVYPPLRRTSSPCVGRHSE